MLASSLFKFNHISASLLSHCSAHRLRVTHCAPSLLRPCVLRAHFVAMSADTTTTQDPVKDEKEVPVKKEGEEVANKNEDGVDKLTNALSALSFLNLSPQDHLLQLDRTICEKCKRKRKYFCYECMIPMGDPKLAPRLKLPLSVDIIHHPTELLSKSTAIHAKVIAPEDVTVYEFPDIPDYNLEETVLLFPSDTASNIRDLDIKNIKKVVFVDSQWQKTKRMLLDPRISKLNCVKIDLQKTLFWRYQSKGDECLATIEAIYYFFKEYQQKACNGEYKGEYDDLMYYYALFYGIIQDTYKKKQREFPRIDNYIKET